MYILEPVVHETLWGGTKLKKYVDTNVEAIGHLYLVDGHEEMSNKILNGEYVGQTLKELFELKKTEWNLDEFEEFPLTIALVDAKKDLSIQVHPDDVTALELEHKKIGKTESWLFLEAPVSGWIYNGCLCDTNEQIEEAVINNRMEEITDRMPIKKDDYVCVEAGTLHAMTEGSLVYEIEYGSDYTYRFYDYNRKDSNGNTRELHIDKALKSIKPEIVPSKRNSIGTKWIQEDVYEICRVFNLDTYKNESEEIECITILKGYGTYETCEISSGMSILLFPNEEIKNWNLEDIIIARIRRS